MTTNGLLISSNSPQSSQMTPVISVNRREIVEECPLEPRMRQDRHRLIWAPAGALAIQTDGQDWVLPPTRALWIPPGVTCRSRALGTRVLYRVGIAVEGSPVQWRKTTSVAVSPLIRELISFLGRQRGAREVRRDAERLLLDLLGAGEVEAIDVPLPRDPRALAVAEALIDAPDDGRDLGAWGSEVGASIRTLARLFASETGMTFVQWRTQVRMRAALVLLADGERVGTVARRVGYAGPSAFTTAFRRAMGCSPGEWVAEFA